MKDAKKAVALYTQAAAQHFGYAEYALAYDYESGSDGLSLDPDKSRFWYLRAAGDGVSEAKKWLAAHPQ